MAAKQWICPKCGLKTKVSVWPVRCACGHVGERPTLNRTAVMDEPTRRSRGAPHWEIKARMDVCRACEHYVAKKQSCPRCGCCRTHHKRQLHSTLGECPEGRWPEVRLPWISYSHLVVQTLVVVPRLPRDISRIVGVPRSGMLPASILATHLHVPLYSLRDGDIVPIGNGRRMEAHREHQHDGTTLIVDDTTASGYTMAQIQERYDNGSGSGSDHVVTFTPYCCPDATHKPDLYSLELPLPHLLEWCFFASGYVTSAMVALEGVLQCDGNGDGEDGDDSDSEGESSRGVPTRFARHLEIRTIISTRPESERRECEQWLRDWDIRYKDLILMPDGQEPTAEAIASYKINAAQESTCYFVVENNIEITARMRACGLRVLCISDGWLR